MRLLPSGISRSRAKGLGLLRKLGRSWRSPACRLTARHLWIKLVLCAAIAYCGLSAKGANRTSSASSRLLQTTSKSDRRGHAVEMGKAGLGRLRLLDFTTPPACSRRYDRGESSGSVVKSQEVSVHVLQSVLPISTAWPAISSLSSLM